MVIAEFDDDTDQIDGAGRRYILSGVWDRADELTDRNIDTYPVVSLVAEGNMHMVPVPDEGDLTGLQSRFFTQREDGRLLIYDLDYSFWDEAAEDVLQVPDVQLADGTPVTETYFRGKIGGCGIFPSTNVVDQRDVEPLVSYGTTNAGATIFVATDYSLEAFSNLRRLWMFQNLSEEEYPDFDAPDAQAAAVTALAAQESAPFFFYRDSFGRLVQFTRGSLAAGTECGKPVIYLYPEEEMSLEVYVDPKGGFTHTEPVYNDGWRVSTTPDSVITNLDDGQVYPYLFWEGRGGMYTSPEQYWVVARADVPTFLTETLAKIGFNEKEIADFNEFWLPRMQNAPYYKIGFHGTGVMDQLAPLTLSVKPDAILRVLMDFEELDAPIKSNPPRIRPFVRHGFTVTEWGGVLR